MTNAEQQLAAIGFGQRPSEPACWRSVRLDAPSSSRRGRAAAAAAPAEESPVCSASLARWRAILACEGRSSPYRITRIRR